MYYRIISDGHRHIKHRRHTRQRVRQRRRRGRHGPHYAPFILRPIADASKQTSQTQNQISGTETETSEFKITLTNTDETTTKMSDENFAQASSKAKFVNYEIDAVVD